MSSILLRAMGGLLHASVIIFWLLPMWGAAQVLPELPRTSIDTTYVPPTGRTITVPAGGDFQAALHAAQPGDVITLAAGPPSQAPSPCLINPAPAGSPFVRVPQIVASRRRAPGLLPPIALSCPNLWPPHLSQRSLRLRGRIIIALLAWRSNPRLAPMCGTSSSSVLVRHRSQSCRIILFSIVPMSMAIRR